MDNELETTIEDLAFWGSAYEKTKHKQKALILVAALRAENDRLREVLGKIMAHKNKDPHDYDSIIHDVDCGAFDPHCGYTCDCGLVDALRACEALV